ncbi:MAG: PAS domain-containing protein, partial [Aquincola tertiaricarbonis]
APFEAVHQHNLGAAASPAPPHLPARPRLNLAPAPAARAATAYRAAADFAASGLAHLPPGAGPDELAGALRLMQAHAEFLAGHPARAEPLLLALIHDAPDAVAHAAATRVLMSLQVMASRYADAVQAALACLDRFGLRMPAHPTQQAVQQAYDDVQARLSARPLEALLDLPACTDAEVEAAMGVLAELFAPACFTDERLALLHLCAMVDFSLSRGVSPGTPHGLAWFGVMSGRLFGRYREGLALARLSLRLTERPGLRSARARALFSLEIASVWAAPLGEAIAHGRAAVDAAAQTGELAVACFARHHVVNDRLVRGDALDAVAREIEDSLPPVRQAQYDDVIDELLSQQRFVAALQGRTAALHRLDGDGFDSAAFEARLTPDRMPTMIFWHRVLQAQLAFIAGRPWHAQAALDAAAPLLWSAVHLQIANFHLFSVLCWAALARRLPVQQRQPRRRQVQALLQGLQAWRDGCPEGFADLAALAEAQWTCAVAGPLQALPQHEQAVALAQASGRSWLEALASELSARCHAQAGLPTAARAHWRHARSAWLRWGAMAKVRQLDRQQPWLAEEAGAAAAGPPLVQVDLDLVARVSQTITGEMDGSRLVHTLMATALDLGDADRGLLLVPDGQPLLLRAVATRSARGIDVQPCTRPVTPDDLPPDMLARAVQHSRIVSLDEMPAADAAAGAAPRAVAALCLPLLRQGRLSGVLYLERQGAAADPGGFSRERAALLALLASQGAVALDNARLYRDLTHEIRERRQAEHEAEQSRAALQESENRFRRMADATPDVIWITDIHPERVLYANPSFERTWGRPVEALYRDPRLWTDCIHPDDRERINTEFGRWLTSAAPQGWDVDYRIVRPDGSLRWIHERGFFVVDDEGRPHRVSGISSDVTAARLAAAALRESEERFALAVAGSNDGIWDWDLASDRMFLSERAQRLYGLSPGMDTRPRSEWVAMVRLHPDDTQPQQAMLRDYLEQRLPHYDFEGRVLHAGDGYRWVRIRGLCIRGDDGRAMRMAGSVSDIDSMRRAEAALRQAQRLEAVGTLAGGVAHDFNNILGAILGFGEMALRNTRAGSRQRRDLECIVAAGERGRALVERILAFSRSSVGERVPVHVEAVVREALALLDAMRPAFVAADVRLAAGRAAMIGDATQVHQLVTNLVTNALHAMPQGGRLTVALQPQALAEPVQTTTGPLPAGDYLVLVVSDTGSGIEPEILDRIFDPFFTTKEVGTGTGLGLSLVHGIVTDLGGAVD